MGGHLAPKGKPKPHEHTGSDEPEAGNWLMASEENLGRATYRQSMGEAISQWF